MRYLVEDRWERSILKVARVKLQEATLQSAWHCSFEVLRLDLANHNRLCCFCNQGLLFSYMYLLSGRFSQLLKVIFIIRTHIDSTLSCQPAGDKHALHPPTSPEVLTLEVLQRL